MSVNDYGECLESVMVTDAARQYGLGRVIVEAAGKRWPKLYWLACGSSRNFHAALVAGGIATRRDNGDLYYFVPKENRPNV